MTPSPFVYTEIDSPIGALTLASDGTSLTGLYLPKGIQKMPLPLQDKKSLPIFMRACLQLEEYFAHQRTLFDLPLAATGTAFQKLVWQALVTIPFGKTASYQQIAWQIGRPKAMRPVGMANARNPIAIIVPCHRVIGAKGDLVGFGGGLPMKSWLLKHEKL